MTKDNQKFFNEFLTKNRIFDDGGLCKELQRLMSLHYNMGYDMVEMIARAVNIYVPHLSTLERSAICTYITELFLSVDHELSRELDCVITQKVKNLGLDETSNVDMFDQVVNGIRNEQKYV